MEIGSSLTLRFDSPRRRIIRNSINYNGLSSLTKYVTLFFGQLFTQILREVSQLSKYI